MDDNKVLLVFLIVFVLIIAFSFGLSNYNEITPAVAEAQAGMSIGTNTTMLLEKGASIGLKILGGAVFTGLAAAAFSEARKAYNAWIRTSHTRRWQSGPNANWQKLPTAPTLKKEDLMLLALMGKYPADKLTGRPRAGKSQLDPADDDLDIEL